MNILEQLKTHTRVVADSGDFESIKAFKPLDATTNPSLIYAAAQDLKYTGLIEKAISVAKKEEKNPDARLNLAMDHLFVNFGLEILKVVPGRVSTETDARLSFDTDGTIKKARELISLYENAGIKRTRILIKIASTWEGILAARMLKDEGINCNMTLLFSIPQAIACAEAGVQLISPFVGRVLDWYITNGGDKEISPADEPGVILVKNIFNYYKKFGYPTEIMAASFRNTGEITELAGCDLMTIAPKLLAELEKNNAKLDKKLDVSAAKLSEIKRLTINEPTFRWMMNEDAMATEKLAEGIRKFTADILKLEHMIAKKL